MSLWLRSDHVPLNPAEKCPIDPFIIVPDQCAFVDIQSLKLQVRLFINSGFYMISLTHIPLQPGIP